MRRVALLAAVLAAALPVAGTAIGQQDEGGPAPAAEVKKEKKAKPALRNGCARLYRQSYHAEYAREVYRRDTISKAARKKLKRLRVCARSAEAGRNMRAVERREKQARVYRIQLYALTPYVCGKGLRSAIPCYIVQCESKFSWGADNPNSDARGYYQLLGHGEPWPVRTEADKMAHHRIAARLWAGGRGASHWSQCL